VAAACEGAGGSGGGVASERGGGSRAGPRVRTEDQFVGSRSRVGHGGTTHEGKARRVWSEG